MLSILSAAVNIDYTHQANAKKDAEEKASG
jgi:hypothetical protein